MSIPRSAIGTIFRYVPGAKPTTLTTFTGTNGAYPQCPLFRDDAGNLWGLVNSTQPVGNPDPIKIGSVFVLSAGRGGAKGNYLARVSDVGETHAGSGLVQLTLGATGSFPGALLLQAPCMASRGNSTPSATARARWGAVSSCHPSCLRCT